MRMVFHPACLSIVNNTGLSVLPVGISCGINEDTENSAIFVDKVGHHFFVTPVGTPVSECPCSFLVEVTSLSLHQQITALLVVLVVFV
jgi:hypothetical protein